MKKSLVIIGALALVLLLAAFALPILFKSRIQQAVDSSIAESVQARVSYEDFGLSLFRSFPKLSLSVEQLSVVGIEQFEGDTLVAAKEIAVSLNPFQALFSDKLEISSIGLLHPRMLIRILEDGTANYNIATETDTVTGEETPFDLGINKWTVEEGSLVYDDQQTGVYTEVSSINHEGGGDFSQDLFDLHTSTEIFLVSMKYQGVDYMVNKQVGIEMILEMNLPESRYTFKDNQVSINDFAFGFDGWLAMPENTDDLMMDLTFETRQNEFQHLLSCVPGMYREGFDNIITDGLVTMDGKVEGVYNELQVPAFQLSLNVEDGMFQYPELPTAVSNINLDMILANKDGDPDHTLIDISQLHLEFGQSPLDGSLRIEGLSRPEIKAELSTAMDLTELTSMFPMEGTTLNGYFELDMKASGIYDSTAQMFPVVDANMKLENGFIKSDEFPESLQHFNLITRVSNPTGYLPDTRVEVPDFSFIMDGEAFNGHLVLDNPHNYSWDLAIDGGIDLEKLGKVFALSDMTLTGTLRGHLTSSGKMSSLEAEEYQDIPTSGDFIIENFSYASEELTHPFEIHKGKASFTPEHISLTEIKAQTGSTDLRVNGGLSNYINYVFKENASISGNLDIESENTDLNEWMTESTSLEETESLTVFEIPSNIDFRLKAKAGTVHYDNMTLRNVRGLIHVKNGLVEMQDLSFNSLGGGFLVNGTYDPRDLNHPKFDMGIEMQQVSFKDAFNTFNTVRVLAPVAQFIVGDFSSNFKFDGELQQDMMPALSTISGNGLLNIAAATLSGMDSKLVQGFTEITRFSNAPTQFNLKDLVMAVKIKNGQLDVAPFSARFGDYQTLISGSTGIDGSMNFNLNMEVPAGVVGTSVNQAIAQLTSSNQPVDDKVNFNIALAGSYHDPQFSLGGTQGESTTAGLARSAAEQKSAEVKDSARVLVDQETEKLTETAQQQLDTLLSGNVKDSTSSNAVKEAAKELLNKDKVDEVFNLFKKKKVKKEQSETKEEGNKN